MNVQGDRGVRFARMVLAHRFRRDRCRDRAFDHGVGRLMGYMPPLRFTEDLVRTIAEIAGSKQADSLAVLASSIAMSAIAKNKERLNEIIMSVRGGDLARHERIALLMEAEAIEAEIAELVERMEAISD